jgi:hypothetical protein
VVRAGRSSIRCRRVVCYSGLIEPALTLRGGWRQFKLQVQLGMSRNLTHPDFPQVENYVSVGGYVAMGKGNR